METLTIAQTARHLGLSDQGVRKMIERQELFILPGTNPAKLSTESVETVRLLRREALLVDLASRRRTPVTLAREVRSKLIPPNDTVLPHRVAEHQRRRLSLVASDARQLFGVASLTAACAVDGCRWCLAAKFSQLLGGWAPTEYSPAFAALFDQQPCERCGPALFGAVLASLRARVHGEAVRPPEAAPRPSEAERERAREWVAERAVTAAARPVADDDGKALVSRRLRTARARLKDAKRRGDQRHALQLAQMIRGLEKDAAAVDGRVTSVSRPGRLACGHLLSAGCSCPRRASVRGQR